MTREDRLAFVDAIAILASLWTVAAIGASISVREGWFFDLCGLVWGVVQ